MRACSYLFVLLFVACGGGETPTDAAAPTDSGSDAQQLDGGGGCVAELFPNGDPDGASDPLTVPTGQVRAGRLTGAQLPTDPAGLGTWRPGDFVLTNGRVAAIVSDGMPRENYDPYPGRLIGLARVEGAALTDPADFGILLLGLGRFAVATESVTVIADGSDGGAAIVRASGRLAPIRTLDNLLDALLPGDFEGLPAAIEYELAPGADVVDVHLSVRAGDRSVRSTLGALQLFFQTYRMPAWAPSTGFAERGTASRPPYLAFDGSRRTSYAWAAAGGTLNPLVSTSGADVFTTDRVSIDACGEERLHLGRVVIAGPGIAPVQAAIAGLTGSTLRTVTGTVLEQGGAPATDVRVHVTTEPGEHLTRAWPAEDGTFSIDVDDRAAQLWAYRRGQRLVGPIAIVAGDNEIRMPAFGTVVVTATDADSGTALPARIEAFPASATDFAVPEAFGEESVGGGRVHAEYPTNGQAGLRLAPGTWTIRVSRGPEYEEIVRPDLPVAAGSTSAIAAALEHVVDTTGVMCADYHIHTHRSVDSTDTSSLKVQGLVANGLEIAIRSEHEWVADFQPVVDALGVGAFARGLAGLELTTFRYGHFGVFPLVPSTERPSGGAVMWYERLAPDVFEEVRTRTEAPALIINHPRAGGLRQGYFTETGFDPVTGTVTHPENWDEDFDVVEVFNESDLESNRESTVRDWLSLLSSGRHVFAVGSSDSHRIHTVPVGYPRTCLRLGTDDPRAVTGAMVRDATRAGRSVISGGIYLDVTGPGGAQPGDEATGAGARASFEVVVQAASWIDVDRLEVIVDGVTTETIPITPADADPTNPVERARMTIEADVATAGSYVIFHAAGNEELDLGKRPFAVSNPIFLRR